MLFSIIFHLFSIPLRTKSKGIFVISDVASSERRTWLLGMLFLIMYYLNSIAFFIKDFSLVKASEIILFNVLTRKEVGVLMQDTTGLSG